VNTSGQKPGKLKPQDVTRRFDRAAVKFDAVDFVHRHAAKGLFERMSPMLVNVERVLDAGAATGSGSRALARRFPRSRVLCLDSSAYMLKRAKKKRSRFARISELRADATRLPLREGSIDLVFANMLLPWIDDLPAFFMEINRVLRKDGLFVFSSLGPDSLGELRQAWSTVDRGEHVNAFIDMHDVGDRILQAGLREPVLDVDYLSVTYRSAGALFEDLTLTGARNSLEGRRKSLTGKNRFGDMKRALAGPAGDKSLVLRLELVFGHAWGSGLRSASGEFRLDVGDIGRRSRRRSD